MTVSARSLANVRLKVTPSLAATKATQPVAETGTDNSAFMTALRTKQSIVANAKFGLGLDDATITRETLSGQEIAVIRDDRLQFTNSTDTVTIERAENARFRVDAESTDAGYWNGLVATATNSTSDDSTLFPTAVTGLGCNRSDGSTAFGGYFEAIARAAGAVTNEIDSFNYYGNPAIAYPPDRSIGITTAMPIAITIGAGGDYPSFAGTHVVKEGSSPQQFIVGHYVSPDAAFSFGVFVDANSTSSPSVSASLRNTGATSSNQNLALQMMSATPDAGAKFIAATNSAGSGVFNVLADGTTQAKDYEFLDGSTAIDNVAWTSYTPTVTSSSGSITTVATRAGRYKKIGKTVFWQASTSITTNGTGAGSLNVTLPAGLLPAYDTSGAGRNRNITGDLLQVIVTASSDTVSVNTYNNLYPVGDGAYVTLFATYEVA